MHLRTTIRTLAVATASAALLAAASAADAAPTFPGPGSGGPRGAVFVQNDNVAGNAIAVYDRSPDGTLTLAGTYPTGGDGGALNGAMVDDLASQGSLVYDAADRLLFAVNAGSDTITVFAVRGDVLARVQVIGSGGGFPVSIAVHGNLLYVLDALDGGAVQGYLIAFGRLLPIPGSARALGLNADATPQYTTTPGEVAFNPDGRQLIVTTKDNTNAIDVFAVGSFGLLAPTPVVNSEPGTVPFAVAFGPGGQLDVAEAGPDAIASFALAPDGVTHPLGAVATGEAATCWIVADGPLLFAENAGGGTVSSIVASPLGGLTLWATTPTSPGTVDAAISPDGRFLYVQTGGAGIVDEFMVGPGGSLAEIGSVTVAGAQGGEGIAAS